MGSERSFGIIFGIVFAVICLLPLISRGAEPRLWAGVIAATFFSSAIFTPALLRPLNQLWFKFGLLLHHVMNPIIMGLLFYGAFVPTGLALRYLGKDLLRLKREAATPSYWVPREPAGPKPGTMSKQF